MSRLLPEEQATFDAYQANALEWALAHNAPLYWFNEMVSLQMMLPPGAHLLEIGCGSGRDASELVNLGFDYTGVDISPAMLALARQRLPYADFRQANVCDMVLPDVYDGFWAACSLVHTPRSRIDQALGGIRAHLIDGAPGFIAMKPGDSERYLDTPEGGTRFFSFWRPDEFSSVLARNGFKVVEDHTRDGKLCFFVRRVGCEPEPADA
jgi:SAM-dependent methyltransferase